MNNSNKMYHGWIDFYRETKMLTAKDAVQKALVNVRRLLKHKTLDPDQRKEAKNIEEFLIVTELKLIAYNNRYSPACKAEIERTMKNVMKDFDGGESDG